MKVGMKIIFVFLIMFATVTQKSYSQRLVDTLIEVSIENYVADATNKLFKFDIYLIRTSNAWHLWQNATFQMEFLTKDAIPVNYEDFDVEIDISQTEILTTYTGTPVYQIMAKVLINEQIPAHSRVKMLVMGPEDLIDAKVFAEYSKLKLCTVILRAENDDAELPRRIVWKEPSDYYQAIAYKFVESVNALPEYVIVANESDNIDMAWTTNYVENFLPPPALRLQFFDVEYTGNLNVVCRYATVAEYNNAGFVLKRGVIGDTLSAAGYEALPDSIFNVVVGDFRDPDFTDRMQGMGNSYYGKIYDPIPDIIEHRMVNYVYRLYSENLDEVGLRKVATRNLITPNAVISRASAYPNPTQKVAFVEYTVEDDVYLTCIVYDQNGRKVRNLGDLINGLLDMTYVSAGTYTVVFEAPELASQGMYDVMFIAYPINDRHVEISKANVKIQLVKGYQAAE